MDTISLNDDDGLERRRQRARARAQTSSLQSMSSANGSSASLASSRAPITPSLFGMNSSYLKRMEEVGRLRRLQSQPPLAPTDTKVSPRPRSDLSTPVTVPSIGQSRRRPVSEVPPPYTSPTDSTFTDSSLPIPEQDLDEPETGLDPSPLSDDQEHPPLTGEPALEARIIQLLRDLEVARAALSRAATEHEEEKQALLARLAASEERSDLLTRRLETQERVHAETRNGLEHARATVSALTLEKRGWQAKLDAMNFKVQHAGRVMRTVDHITRAKLEVRKAEITGVIRRTRQIMSVAPVPSIEVLGAMTVLNEEILQLANIFVENLQRVAVPCTYDDLQRAKFVLGDGVTVMMEEQANSEQQGFRFLLMQVALEVFMTFWCSSIIDGLYPQQRSFSDLLLELSTQSVGNSMRNTMDREPLIHCGKPIQVIHTNDKSVMASKFSEWVDEIVSDLGQILLVGGLKIRPQRFQVFVDKFVGLVKMAYNMRAALAERDICGWLELCVVAPDTPFQAKWMDEAHDSQTPVFQLEREPIAGTCALGLQRQSSAQRQSQSNDIEHSALNIVMKPKVVVLSTLDDV